MTYHIYQLVDEDGAAEAARLLVIRERLAGLWPVTRPRLESGDSLAVRLFPGAKPVP